MKNKRKKLNLNKLFYNNRFALVFSIVAAVIVWLSVAVVYSPEDERVIENVPVKIELSEAMQDYGLRAFGAAEYNVDVVVRGQRHNVSPKALSKDDIIVKANTNYVDSAGKYTLQLTTSVSDSAGDVEIVNTSISFIDVYFDVEKRMEYPLEINFIAANGVAEKDYYIGETSMSAKTVKISGPELEVNKITGVSVNVSITKPLTQTETFDGDVVALTALGEEPRYITYSTESTGVTVTVPVMKKTTLKTGVSFINSPVKYLKTPLEYTVTPEEALFAVPERKLDSMNGTMSIVTVDFSELLPGENTFMVESVPAESGLLIDEKVKSFTVKVLADGVKAKKVDVPVSSIELFSGNDDTKIDPDSPAVLTVTVVGPAESLNKITPESLSLKVDASQLTAEDEAVDASVSISVIDSDDCWINGHYTVGIVHG